MVGKLILVGCSLVALFVGGFFALFYAPACDSRSGFVTDEHAAYNHRCDCFGLVGPSVRPVHSDTVCLGIVRNRSTSTDTALEVEFKNPRRFENISSDNQRAVRESYKRLLGAFEEKDYSSVLREANSILALVDGYNDTEQYRDEALKQLKAQKR